jgi:hypothetical protein
MENNPWLGAFSTTNRSSTGGCQFFVDVLSGNSASGKIRDYEEVHRVPEQSMGTEESLPNAVESTEGIEGIEGGDLSEEGLARRPEQGGAAEEVVLLDVDAEDLQNLSQCSERSAHAESTGVRARPDVEEAELNKEGPATRDSPVAMSTSPQVANRGAWTASTESTDSYQAPPAWSGHGTRGFEAPMLEIPELSLSDSVMHDEEQDFPVSSWS